MMYQETEMEMKERILMNAVLEEVLYVFRETNIPRIRLHIDDEEFIDLYNPFLL